jgi:hypothetical protein
VIAACKRDIQKSVSGFGRILWSVISAPLFKKNGSVTLV